jgi:hypothetical protein
MPFLSEHGVNAIRNGFEDCLEERGRRSHVGPPHEFDYGELEGAMDGHEWVELAFGGSHLG